MSNVKHKPINCEACGRFQEFLKIAKEIRQRTQIAYNDEIDDNGNHNYEKPIIKIGGVH